MGWKDVGKTVAKFAPILGTILGGPAGAVAGAAGSLLSQYLGVEDSPDAVQAALTQDPDAAVKIQKLLVDKEVELQRMAEETERVYVTSQSRVYEAQAKADGQSTRPKIAYLMAWMLAIPYVLVGAGITYAVVMNMVKIEDMWPTVLAYLGVPLSILRMYFGELRKEQGQRLGVPVPSLSDLFVRK